MELISGVVVPLKSATCERFVVERCFIGSPLTPCSDCPPDHLGSFGDALLVEWSDHPVDTSAGRSDHGVATMEAQVEGDSWFAAGIGEGTVDGLPVHDRNIAGSTHQRHCIRQSLTSGLGGQR